MMSFFSNFWLHVAHFLKVSLSDDGNDDLVASSTFSAGRGSCPSVPGPSARPQAASHRISSLEVTGAAPEAGNRYSVSAFSHSTTTRIRRHAGNPRSIRSGHYYEHQRPLPLVDDHECAGYFSGFSEKSCSAITFVVVNALLIFLCIGYSVELAIAEEGTTPGEECWNMIQHILDTICPEEASQQQFIALFKVFAAFITGMVSWCALKFNSIEEASAVILVI